MHKNIIKLKSSVIRIAIYLTVFFTISIALVMLSARASDPVDPDQSKSVEELRIFNTVSNKIKSLYVDPVSDKKLANQSISDMVSGLDPHSAYMSADEFKELETDIQGEFGGIGINVGTEGNYARIDSVMSDSPALKSGLKSGDLIYEIDHASIKGMSFSEAIKLMKGKPNTSITLTIMRKGTNKPFQVTLMRAIVKIKSVKYKLSSKDFGYIRITQFQERTGEETALAIKDLGRINGAPLKGIVLDLRNNPGGLVNSAAGVASAFLPKNSLIVYTEGRAADSRSKYAAIPDCYLMDDQTDYLKDMPAWSKRALLIVMVNAGSASASEIVAGALQDNGRATILGTQSFGKGSVQTIIPLGDGTGIKLTTARYFTPKGRSIQVKGITPDIIIAEGKLAGGNSKNGYGSREVDLDHHLRNPDALDTPATKQATNDNPVTTAKATASADLIAADDYQLNQALLILHDADVIRRNHLTRY